MSSENLSILVFVGGFWETLDLDKSNLPTITQNFSILERDWEGIGTTESVQTNFRVPCTRKNDRIFQNYSNPATQSVLAPLDAEIRVGGMPVFSGKIYLDKATSAWTEYGGTVGVSYELIAASTRASWGQRLNSLKLADLDFWAESALMSDALVMNGLDAEYPTQRAGFCFIKYSDIWQDKPTGMGTGTEYPDLQEATGFVFVKAVFDAIANHLGIQFESDFMNDARFFTKLILPLPQVPILNGDFSNEFLAVKASQSGTAIDSTPILFDTLISSPTIGANPLDPSGLFYKAPFKGDYEFQFAVSYTVAIPFGLVASLLVFVNGTPTPAYGFSAIDLAAPIGALRTFSFSFIIELQLGDELTIYNFGATAHSATLQVGGEARPEYGKPAQPFYIKYLFRDWSARDFVLGVKQLFNLKFETNFLGETVRVEPENAYYFSERPVTTPILQGGFYQNSSQPYDLGARVNTRINLQIDAKTDTPARKFYQYKQDDNDAYGKTQDSEGFIPRYGVIAPTANGLNPDTDDLINAFFAGTTQILDQPASYIGNVSGETYNPIQLPLMLPDFSQTRKFIFEPRIFIFRRRSDWLAGDGWISYTTGNDPINLTQMRHSPAFVVNTNDPTGFDMSLSLSDYTVSTRLIRGLIYNFYAMTLAQDQNTKQLTLSAFLELDYVRSLSFRDKVMIKSGLYRILSIQNYNPVYPERAVTIQLQPNINEFFDNFIHSPIAPNVQ